MVTINLVFTSAPIRVRVGLNRVGEGRETCLISLKILTFIQERQEQHSSHMDRCFNKLFLLIYFLCAMFFQLVI